MVRSFIITNEADNIKEIKLDISYSQLTDGYDTERLFKTDWFTIHGEVTIPFDVERDNSDCYVVYVYLITNDDMSYRHKFRSYIKTKDQEFNIKITSGQKAPVVTIDGINGVRRDDRYVYSLCTCICGCCDVERGLDDIEQAEHDADHGCTIF